MKKYLLILFCFQFLFSCKNDDDAVTEQKTEGANVVVINEGNFGFGNGSISVYNESTTEVANKIFQTNNSGRPIGDVVQSVVQIDNRLFVVVNNSSKIEVLDKANFKSVGSIHNLNSPRYVLPLNTNKAYVSDLYEDKIYMINTDALTISGTIETKGWTEEMAAINNKVYVCHVDSNEVWIINPQTNKVLKKINTNQQPQHLEVDKNGNLWISCSGGLSDGKAALYHLNTINDSIINIFELQDSQKSIGEIEINKEKDKIYYLGTEGMFEMKIDAMNLPVTPKIASNNRLFYGLAVNASNNEIYLSDAIDYLQKGVVYRYNEEAELLNTFKVGIIPGDIYFIE